jgi:hypothetical protein
VENEKWLFRPSRDSALQYYLDQVVSLHELSSVSLRHELHALTRDDIVAKHSTCII